MKDPLLYIVHIHEELRNIVIFTQDGVLSFKSDIKTQNAVIRSFEVIGEATKRLPSEFTAQYPNLPWRKMAGLRDILIHAYDRVDLNEVWGFVERDVPILLMEIQAIREKLEAENAH